MTDIKHNIDVIILAGGRGTRLNSVLSDRPKVLANINGRPFIFFLLDQICEAKFDRVIICTGYMGEYLENVIGNVYKSLHIDFSREKILLGTGGALRKATDLIKREWILVLNGDSYVDIRLQDLVSWHIKIGARFSVVVTSIEDSRRFGSVSLNFNNEIDQFVEKYTPDKTNTRANNKLINAGIYLIHKSIIQSFPTETAISLEREILPSQIGKGIFGYEATGSFIDIGTPESFRSAPEFFRSLQAGSNRST